MLQAPDVGLCVFVSLLSPQARLLPAALMGVKAGNQAINGGGVTSRPRLRVTGQPSPKKKLTEVVHCNVPLFRIQAVSGCQQLRDSSTRNQRIGKFILLTPPHTTDCGLGLRFT